jgi:Nucleotide-diphospho-sugar transferase
MNSGTTAFLRDTTVFTIATAAWVSFVLNLLASFEASGIDPRRLVVYALDDDTERSLQHAGVPLAQIKRHDVGQVDDWVIHMDTPEFNRIMSAKYAIAVPILRSGRSVLFVDGDVVFLRDPTAYLSAVASTSRADLIMQFELPKNEYNAGFWYANNSPSVIELFTQMERSLLCDESLLHDQDMFNSMVASGTKLRIHPLDVKLFACGNQIYETPEVAEDAYILHFNYLSGPERRSDKLLAMERVGAVMHPRLASDVRRAKRRVRARAAVRCVTPRPVRRAVRRILPRSGRPS